MPKAMNSARQSLLIEIAPAALHNSGSVPAFFIHSDIPAQPGSVSRRGSSYRGWAGVVVLTTLLLLLYTGSLHAQANRGTLVHEETIRVSPSTDTAKLGDAQRGHELIILDTSRDWVHVQAIIREPRRDPDEDDEEAQGKTITGWVLAKGVVGTSTPNGDKIIFGEAANSEDEASRRRGRRDAAQDAMRLYYRVYDLFP